MRKKVLSCVVAGTLAFSTPLLGNVALAADDSHLSELSKVNESLANTYLGNQVDKLLAQAEAGLGAEEQDAIEAQIEQLFKQAVKEGLLPASALEGIVDDEAAPETPGASVTPGDATDDSAVGQPAEPSVPSETVPDADAPSSDAGEEPEGPTAEDPSAPDAPEAPEASDDPEVVPGEEPDVPAVPESPVDPSVPSEGEGQPAVPVPDADEAPVAEAPSAPAVDPSNATALPLVPQANGYDSGDVPRYDYAENMDTEKFIALIGEQARAIAQENDLYASVMIAQAILESASGQSDLAQAPNNNLFGIKGAWEDEKGSKHSVSFLTSEDDGTGALYQIVSDFRAYDTLADSLEDYAELLTGDSMGAFYQGAWKKNAKTYADAAKWLEGRYATDTHYAEKLVGLIETYHLDRFDEALDWTPVDENVDLTDLLAEVTSHMGTPYVWGGASPLQGFDCSGLVQYSYREALDIELPRTTYEQCLEGEVVSFEDLHPGDLLFFNDDGDIHHVALYLGDGFYIHAPRTGEPVQVGSMEEYQPSFAKRIVETRPVEEAPVVSKVLTGLKSLLS